MAQTNGKIQGDSSICYFIITISDMQYLDISNYCTAINKEKTDGVH